MTHKLVFIASSPRSGSTVLLNKLALFNRIIALPSDLQVIKFLVEHRNAPSEELGIRFKQHWLSRKGDKSDKTMMTKLAELRPTSIEDFLLQVFKHWAEIKGQRFSEDSILLEKSPNNAYYLNDIRSMFPGAKIIHLIRDPRAVVAGLNNKPWSSHNTLTNAIRWNKEQRFLGGNSDFLIRFEALVGDPVSTLQEVLNFMGYHGQDEIDRVLNHDLSIDNPEIAEAGRKLNKNNASKFRGSLSNIDREMEIIESVNQGLMRFYGYETETSTKDLQYYKSYFFKALEHYSNELIRLLKNRKEY